MYRSPADPDREVLNARRAALVKRLEDAIPARLPGKMRRQLGTAMRVLSRPPPDDQQLEVQRLDTITRFIDRVEHRIRRIETTERVVLDAFPKRFVGPAYRLPNPDCEGYLGIRRLVHGLLDEHTDVAVKHDAAIDNMVRFTDPLGVDVSFRHDDTPCRLIVISRISTLNYQDMSGHHQYHHGQNLFFLRTRIPRALAPMRLRKRPFLDRAFGWLTANERRKHLQFISSQSALWQSDAVSEALARPYVGQLRATARQGHLTLRLEQKHPKADGIMPAINLLCQLRAAVIANTEGGTVIRDDDDP